MRNLLNIIQTKHWKLWTKMSSASRLRIIQMYSFLFNVNLQIIEFTDFTLSRRLSLLGLKVSTWLKFAYPGLFQNVLSFNVGDLKLGITLKTSQEDFSRTPFTWNPDLQYLKGSDGYKFIMKIFFHFVQTFNLSENPIVLLSHLQAIETFEPNRYILYNKSWKKYPLYIKYLNR